MKKVSPSEYEVTYKYNCPHCEWPSWVNQEKFKNKRLTIACDFCCKSYSLELPEKVDYKIDSNSDLIDEVKESLKESGFSIKEINSMFGGAVLDTCSTTEEIMEKIFKFNETQTT